MKQLKNKLLPSVFILICVMSSYAQSFGTGNGGGFGRGGGFDGSSNSPNFDNGKPKPPPDPDEIAKEETRLMVKKIKLNEEQEILISSLNEDYAYQRKDLYERIKRDFGNTKPTPKQMADAKEKIEALENKKEEELRKILRPEQFQAYQNMKNKAKKNS